MPRPRNNSLLALFKCNDLNQILCYNEKCDGKILYKHSANLERHLKLLHPYIYSSYIKKKKILKYPRKMNFEKRLIDSVRDYPILWCKSNENRFNEELKNKAWKEISHKLEVTVKTCVVRWESLMDKFKTELNQNLSQRPNEDTSKIPNSDFHSKWKYFPELLFLRDHIDLTTKDSFQIDENIKLDFVKEESMESYKIYNETLEASSQLEYGNDSLIQDNGEKSRLTNELRMDEENISGSMCHDESFGQTNNNYREESNSLGGVVNQGQRKNLHFDESTDEDEDELDHLRKTIKHRKVKLKAENQNSIANDLDPDRMFLLSLWPFLNGIPDRRKLFVRHKLQAVLLEEQNKV